MEKTEKPLALGLGGVPARGRLDVSGVVSHIMPI